MAFWRRCGLQCAKAADLPGRATDQVRLVVNVKAAKALDPTVPRTLLTRADEVIE
jgi:hypothetical protein